uniref:Uncharacterized protein n=1 Tax=Setaria viridis TaxID=4556 RepID=A0A4U6URU1_SETVI|nr:hypothetical protein SEVIR_5G119550v2 [Setaria viridis]
MKLQGFGISILLLVSLYVNEAVQICAKMVGVFLDGMLKWH